MKSGIPPKGAPRSGDHKTKVKWSASQRFVGPYPEKTKQFFRLETLESALQKKLDERDYFLFRTLRDGLDGKVPDSLAIDWIYENKSRLVFSLLAGSRQGKHAASFLCLAKNHEEHTAALEQEYQALEILSKKHPKAFVSLLRSGLIFLPDRHQRREVNRELFSYLYKLPGDWSPLYVASSTQWGPRGTEVRRYSVQESERLKYLLICHLVTAYNAESFEGITPRQLAPDDLWVRKNKDRSLDLVIAGCRRLDRKLRPGQLVASLLFGSFSNGKEHLPLAPLLSDDFCSALAEALSKQEATRWGAAFFKQRKRHEGKLSAAQKSYLPGGDYLDALKDCFR